VITLVEFIHPYSRASHGDKVLATLYYNQRYRDVEELSVSQIRAALAQARIANASKINVADVLSKSGHYVDAAAIDERGRKLWRLTDAGRKYVRERLNLPPDQPEIEQDVSTLRSVAAKISDPIVRGFVDEAITCLSVEALRASIVFLWSGAIRTLHGKAIARPRRDLDAALKKYDPKARDVKIIEDFALIRDKVFLLAIRDLGVIDKGQWTILESALDLRNQCGHPTKYKPGGKKASSFIEDIVGVVFQ
jgi:hypothetical protein